MTNEKPWEKRRPEIRPPIKRDTPAARSEPARPGIPAPRIPGVGLPKQSMPTSSVVASNQRKSSWRKGLVSGSAILIVSLIAVLANKPTGTADKNSKKPNPSVSVASTTAQSPPKSLSQWEELAKSVVYIEASGSSCSWSGSGSIVLDGSYVLTNHHVAGSGECDLRVGYTTSTDIAPSDFVEAKVVVSDENLDLAVIRLLGPDGNPSADPNHKALQIDESQLQLGDKIYTLGYPGVGGATLTLTSGDYSGMDHSDTDFYKTTANMNPGVSGGSALNTDGKLIGVPTAGVLDPETNQRVGLNLIRPISFAKPLLDQALQSS